MPMRSEKNNAQVAFEMVKKCHLTFVIFMSCLVYCFCVGLMCYECACRVMGKVVYYMKETACYCFLSCVRYRVKNYMGYIHQCDDGFSPKA